MCSLTISLDGAVARGMLGAQNSAGPEEATAELTLSRWGRAGHAEKGQVENRMWEGRPGVFGTPLA